MFIMKSSKRRPSQLCLFDEKTIFLPSVASYVVDAETGISMRLMQTFNAVEFRWAHRVDVWYGTPMFPALTMKA